MKYNFGNQFSTKLNGTCTVIKYENARSIYVMFEDGTVVKTRGGNLVSGVVKNPNRPTVFGFGINDVKGIDVHKNKIYILWSSLIRRCYSKVYQKNKPTYVGCSVCDRWSRLSNFMQDIVEIPNFEKSISDGWELDKDVLSSGFGYYSKETCCFLPKEINAFFGIKSSKKGSTGVTYNKRLNKYVVCIHNGIGLSNHYGVYSSKEDAIKAYNDEKRNRLLKLLSKYEGVIPENVHNALLNYKFNVDNLC